MCFFPPAEYLNWFKSLKMWGYFSLFLKIVSHFYVFTIHIHILASQCFCGFLVLVFVKRKKKDPTRDVLFVL